MRTIRILSFFLSIFLLAISCERKEEPRQVIAPKEKTLVLIGVVPAITIVDTIRQYQPIMDYLNKRLT